MVGNASEIGRAVKEGEASFERNFMGDATATRLRSADVLR